MMSTDAPVTTEQAAPTAEADPLRERLLALISDADAPTGYRRTAEAALAVLDQADKMERAARRIFDDHAAPAAALSAYDYGRRLAASEILGGA